MENENLSCVDLFPCSSQDWKARLKIPPVNTRCKTEMAGRFISLVCYINGRIVRNSQGVSYDSLPVRIVRVAYGISFEEFEGIIRNALQISDGERMSMTYRYPLLFGVGNINFTSFSITNEQDLQHVFALLQEFPPPNNMEVYVDVIGRLASSARARCTSENEDVDVASAQRSLENVGPSMVSPVETMNVGTRPMADNSCPSTSRLLDDDLTFDDDSGQSSDDVGEDSDNDDTQEIFNHIHFKDILMRIIENDGSMYPAPMSDSYNYGLSMEEDEARDVLLHHPRGTP